MTYARSYHHDLHPDHLCNEDDIADLMREIHELHEDTELPRYEDPTEEQMQQILTAAETYDGPWYHAHILFHMDPPVSESYAALRETLKGLPQSAGVNVVLSYDMPELDAIFARSDAEIEARRLAQASKATAE